MSGLVRTSTGLGIMPRTLIGQNTSGLMGRSGKAWVCVQVRAFMTLILQVLIAEELVRLLGERVRRLLMGSVLWDLVVMVRQGPPRLEEMRVKAGVTGIMDVLIQLALHRFIDVLIIGMVHLVESSLQGFTQVVAVAARSRKSVV